MNLFKSYNPDYKDGKQKRDFIYIKDVCKKMEFLHFNLPSFHDDNDNDFLFNLGSGKAHTFLDIVLPIFEALQIPVNIKYIDMPSELKTNYQYFTQADMGKLGVVNNPLTSSIKDYVLYYLENKNPYFDLVSSEHYL
jgi:ADP-L-glycero-D-manno-heptose 6-epimerase